MSTKIESVKADFEQTIGRLLKDLDATPDDKLKWSPSPTARTPLEIAYHCAEVIASIHGSLDGSAPMGSRTPAEIDAYCREQEKKVETREQAVDWLKSKSDAYSAWLGDLSQDSLSQIWNSPFGPIPYSVAISLPTYHTANHIAQIEYIQTIYGDRVWH